MLLQKRTYTRGVGISSMRKSIYLLTTTLTSHTHRFHLLPLATPASSPAHHTRLLLTTPIHFTHSPQLSSNLCKVQSMDDNCGEWVECMGVASGCGEQEVGVGRIYGCGCKEVYRFLHTTSSCICSFLQHLFFLFI